MLGRSRCASSFRSVGSPLWVKSRHSGQLKECPLYSQKRTSQKSKDRCGARRVRPMIFQWAKIPAPLRQASDLAKVSDNYLPHHSEILPLFSLAFSQGATLNPFSGRGAIRKYSRT